LKIVESNGTTWPRTTVKSPWVTVTLGSVSDHNRPPPAGASKILNSKLKVPLGGTPASVSRPW